MQHNGFCSMGGEKGRETYLFTAASCVLVDSAVEGDETVSEVEDDEDDIFAPTKVPWVKPKEKKKQRNYSIIKIKFILPFGFGFGQEFYWRWRASPSRMMTCSP